MTPAPPGNGPSPDGAGRPLIFIHGWAMASSVWKRQAGYFTPKGFRVITPDLPGHGAAPDETPFTLSRAAEEVEQLIQNEGIKRPLLIGWSMGSQVILEMMTRSNIEIGAACFVGGTPRFTATENYPHGLPLKDLKGMKAKLRRDPERAVRDFRGAITAGLGEAEKKMVMEAPLPAYDAALAGLDELERADYRETLSKIDTPLLLIHGRDDRVCPFGAGEYLAERIDGAELAPMEGTGHLPFLSGTDLFNEKLEGFIGRN